LFSEQIGMMISVLSIFKYSLFHGTILTLHMPTYSSSSQNVKSLRYFESDRAV
jgi:hypothetical protein